MGRVLKCAAPSASLVIKLGGEWGFRSIWPRMGSIRYRGVDHAQLLRQADVALSVELEGAATTWTIANLKQSYQLDQSSRRNIALST